MDHLVPEVKGGLRHPFLEKKLVTEASTTTRHKDTRCQSFMALFHYSLFKVFHQVVVPGTWYRNSTWYQVLFQYLVDRGSK